MTDTRRFRTVVGYDFSPQADLALERAIGLTAGFDDAEVHVVAGIDHNNTNRDFPHVDKSFEGADSIREMIQKRINDLVAEIQPPSVHTFVHTWINGGADTILAIAEEVRADIILVGTHSKKGIARMVLGSVSERVAREARCPVLVVRQTSYGPETPNLDIEPPCPACIKVRHETAGATWWCQHHDHAPPYPSPLRSHARHDPEAERKHAWVVM